MVYGVLETSKTSLSEPTTQFRTQMGTALAEGILVSVSLDCLPEVRWVPDGREGSPRSSGSLTVARGPRGPVGP
jgi:hypothetical protein